MNNILALTINIEFGWWMILALMTIVWAIIALVKDNKEGNWSGMFAFPYHGMIWIFLNLIIWLIYFIINCKESNEMRQKQSNEMRQKQSNEMRQKQTCQKHKTTEQIRNEDHRTIEEKRGFLCTGDIIEATDEYLKVIDKEPVFQGGKIIEFKDPYSFDGNKATSLANIQLPCGCTHAINTSWIRKKH